MSTWLTVFISGYGAVTVRSEEEYELALAVKEFLENGRVYSCTKLLTALEVLRKRRVTYISGILDEKLAEVIASGKCPDLG